MTAPKPHDTLTLEQAWHFLMTQLAYKNPTAAGQGQYTRRVLAKLMRTGTGW